VTTRRLDYPHFVYRFRISIRFAVVYLRRFHRFRRSSVFAAIFVVVGTSAHPQVVRVSGLDLRGRCSATTPTSKDVHDVLLPLLLEDCKLKMRVQSLVKLDFRDRHTRRGMPRSIGS
jgi:hypothetical protein